MKPASPVYAALPLLLLAACCCGLLFQAAECGGRPPSSPREPSKSPAAAVRRDGDAEKAPLHQRAAGTQGGTTIRPVEMDDGGVGRTSSGDGGAASMAQSAGATPARGKPGPWQRRSGELRLTALKLARRTLAAAAAEAGPGTTGTDGAAASCHSYSEHTRSCPPSKR
ncbi:hypothetical protein PVAP13_9KG028200 [Panicum virgatum]|uniref:Uncharacterized protein n=1 Tax=Panicum virgatum TaxID=38727 RepID=A0A8T0NDS4_PANVG|nr:hypothetical protein PVAP13_9KG028200 [Panicum virgatum]